MSEPANPNTPAWRRADRPAAVPSACATAEDVLAALLDSVEGGELHVRPLRALLDSGRFARFTEIGLALRRAFRDPSRRGYFIARMKPHLRYVIGLLPASIQRHGMLPPEPAPPAPGTLELEQVSDAELRQWLVDDGSLIYGEFQRYELENYFDAIRRYVAPGGEMMDLGSGLGKVVMSAALALPFARCTGVELMGYRHGMAVERRARLLDRAQGLLAALSPQGVDADAPLALPFGHAATLRHLLALDARIVLREQNMFEADVSRASLVFIYSTCFAPLMDALAAKLARELPQGCLVSCTTFPLAHPAFRLLHHFPSNSVAWTSVFVYQRMGPADGPAPQPVHLYAPDPDEWEAGVRAEWERQDAAPA
ncbi:histone methylation protein DOT1-like protein [Massilia sp. Root418]|jgi:hypothetical protein|uniref:histone methylation protein DOT1-like protein n=1 Tax=Massilia sp. Root418 TaxID=1736532 RepID=UPI0006F39691|nr:histone methylation protein DOT1-like protein [Massilia sp. Root418]KQW87851.1 histone methylation protein DOT1-like protein [Massilia sp. Root418]